ncbi:hypothetical protein [Paenibacillus lactis]|uniref:Uncharacterized protein n=1 Tax=Paenibacillus lactis 154 TaxID=743719 RepID=G4HEK8_9BACL|nr:hypothetical protein [Paenibacillus lactis]EHB65277.1 hypothetical protein PaelaDRAFT_2419 [Paenibacillus lactis 154]
MKVKKQYTTLEERESLIQENSDLFLIEEHNITEGNFLVFADEYPELPGPEPTLSEQVAELKQENTLLKAQNSALTERTEFIEDVIAEMAQQVYQ